jgi:hypothetical protein
MVFSYRHAKELLGMKEAPFKVIHSCLPRFFAAAAEKEPKLDQKLLATMVSTLDSILDGTIIQILRVRERGPEYQQSQPAATTRTTTTARFLLAKSISNQCH